jgi:DNA replicative helicase MCM subunit Mcm2 (Cdc46/Mcm family)
MRPRQNNLSEETYIERFKQLFKDCYSKEDFETRMKEIYKGENPETLTDEERNTFILRYLHPERSEREIRKQAQDIVESERELFESIEDFSEEINKIELPEMNIDIPELDFDFEDYDFELPEIEIDSTNLDKILEDYEEGEETL